MKQSIPKRGHKYTWNGIPVTFWKLLSPECWLVKPEDGGKLEYANPSDCIKFKKKSTPIKRVGLKQTTDGEVAKPFKAKKMSPEKINEKNILNKFFAEVANRVPELCDNCKKPLNAFTPGAKRFVTAHILPKSIFKSVATNPGNIMFLGVGVFSDCFCHAMWDNNDAEYRKSMKVYPVALKQAELLYDILTPKEQVMFERYFGLEFSNDTRRTLYHTARVTRIAGEDNIYENGDSLENGGNDEDDNLPFIAYSAGRQVTPK